VDSVSDVRISSHHSSNEDLQEYISVRESVFKDISERRKAASMNREKEESPSIFHSESVESDIGTTEATPVKAWNFGKVMKKIKTKADDIREELKLPPRPKERIKKSASFRSQRA